MRISDWSSDDCSSDLWCDRVQVLCNGMNAGEMRVSDALDVQRALSWMGGNLNDGNEGPGNEPEAPSVQKKEHPVPGPGRVVVMPVLRVKGLKAGQRLNDAGFDVYPGEILGVAGL